MFETLLVANRGEIAVRIIRAAHELGITTYAIFTSVDRKALHVKLSDEAFGLIEDGKTPGYLDMDQIISICNREEIECIHPGYGFLSESEIFAKKVIENGIYFIGPPPEIIKLLGNKVKSREKAIEAGLSVPKGSDIIENKNEAQREAKKIGYPILIKAVFGGGGIGIQKANDQNELELAMSNAQNQALSAFGRGEVFIEKYIENPRHIEFQILGDKFGNVVHLGERECSIQRRNQKLLEESPSMALTDQERNSIGNLACKLAKNLNYESAGTIEFLYKNGQILFNEVNPRIQVEHAVTEMLTGKDIVKEQIRIANGEKLSFKQSDVHVRGHAIELRINAEDPLNKFQPTPGLVKRFVPPGGPNIRFDTSIYEGLEIPNCYDSLIGKLIIGAESRGEAIKRAQNAIKELVIIGFQTNIPFFEELLADNNFQKGEISINFISDNKILEKLEKNVCTTASALFAVGLRKYEYNLPQLSENWQIKGKIDSIGRD